MELFIQIEFQIDFLLELLDLVLQIRHGIFQIADFLHNVLCYKQNILEKRSSSERFSNK
jgi:hypothetical protein